MKPTESIAAELDAFDFGFDSPNRLAVIANDIEANPAGVTLIEPVLRLFERFPFEDFGAPGPLTHAIEQYYKKGYESQLAASLERNPTSLTLWLANRIINAKDENAAQFLKIVEQISNRTDLPPVLIEEARRYLSLSDYPT